MALTEAQLCNLALSKIGERQFIDDLNENTAPAIVCKVLYPQARDSVLERHWWSFATRRANLALSTETRQGWAYCYAAPNDCVTPRTIFAGTRTPSAEGRIPFEWEMNDSAQGHIILTDAQTPELSYTSRITKTALFSSLFSEAVTWDLAARLALALPVKPAVGLRMDEKFDQALRTAIALDLRRRQEDLPPESEFTRARY